MTGAYQLPEQVQLDGISVPINADFRAILQLMQVLDDPSLPELLRWQIALNLFYQEPIPKQLRQPAMEYLAQFLRGGRDRETPGPKLFDWQQDADLIIAGVNRAAGQEIRALPFVHWWTFLSWFHAMDQGQFSAVVGIRDKLRQGKKLEQWEKEFYRCSKDLVELKTRLSPEQQAEKQQLEKLLA